LVNTSFLLKIAARWLLVYIAGSNLYIKQVSIKSRHQCQSKLLIINWCQPNIVCQSNRCQSNRCQSSNGCQSHNRCQPNQI